MTNKEAIEKIKEILFMTGYKEALEIAIKALEDIEILEYRLEVYEHNSNLGDEVEMRGVSE